MSVISEYATKANAHWDRVSAGISGIAEDVAALNAKIAELQNSAGTVTPEDQALIDELQQKGEAVAARVERMDELEPPVVPVE